MYVIIVYDIKVDRVNKVKSFLRQHLFWIQNSVFEGEVTKSQLTEIKSSLKEIIDEEEDSVIIFTTKTEDFIDRQVIGIEKSQIDLIL
ncbi:MAG: CRISPR-associated endonuclease Cas2 [Methanosphaera stadtmanae]|nr:CRISPR-associated endonuclease Cas2 [Methanosphaera stadtmanae]